MELARKARRAEKAGHEDDAYLLYSEASALQPRNKKYKAQMELLQSRADREAKVMPPNTSDAGTAPPMVIPEEVFDSITAKELAKSRPLEAPPELAAKPGVQDFDLNGAPRILFDRIAGSFGLETVYDGDYPVAGPQIRFHVAGADYRQALQDLEAATNSFIVPLSNKLFIVAQDTPQKRNDLEQTMEVAIPVPSGATTQELTEITQAVRQATNVDKIALNGAQSRIVMRDRVSRLLPAEVLLEQIFAYRPEVMIDVEFLDVSDSDVVNYGFNVTNNIPAVYLGRILNNVVTYPSGITNLLTFGAGKTLIGVGVAQAQALFNQTVSSSRTLFRTQIRSADGQPATLHVGEKYPVITMAYAGQVPTGQQNQVYAPPPSFTYEDLGVEVKATPHIHGTGEVTLAVDTSFELLTGDSVNNVPIIARRQLTTQVRLREGEWAVVAGLISSTDSKAVTGFWGLAQVPLLGELFKQTTKQTVVENLLIAIRPHLLSLPPDRIARRELRVGTETRPFIPF